MPRPYCGCGATDEGLRLCQAHKMVVANYIARDNEMSSNDVLFVFDHEGLSREEWQAAGLSD